MSCGCGCHGAPGGCASSGQMMTGTFGLPDPRLDGYRIGRPTTPIESFSPLSLLSSIPGLFGLGRRGIRGFGDICTVYDDNGNCIATEPDVTPTNVSQI